MVELAMLRKLKSFLYAAKSSRRSAPAVNRFRPVFEELEARRVPATTWTVNMTDVGGEQFSPSSITIMAGDSVKWVDVSGSHTTTSDSGDLQAWNSGLLSPGLNFTELFPTGGTFPYHCIPHQSFGMVGTVTVDQAPSITGQPANQTVSVGQPASFSVTATGFPTPTFQWQKFNGTTFVNVTDGGDITGSTTSTLHFSGVVGGDYGQYQVVASNTAGTATSNTVTLNEAPSITSQPSNQTVSAGTATSFSVTATGFPTPTFQWQKFNGTTFVNVSDVGDIMGSTTSTLNFSASAGGDYGQYRVVVSNTVGTAISNTVTLSRTTPFSDTFTGVGPNLDADWQVPPLPTKLFYTYRLRLGFGGFAQNNAAVSVGTSFDGAQVTGLSLQNPTLNAIVNAGGSGTIAVGLMARVQTNNDAYLAVLTSAGNAEIWLFHAATNTITVLGSKPAPPGINTLQFVANGPILSLYLNGSGTALVTANDSTLSGAGDVGIFSWGPNGTINNFTVSGS
jgi:plastocyanin